MSNDSWHDVKQEKSQLKTESGYQYLKLKAVILHKLMKTHS